MYQLLSEQLETIHSEVNIFCKVILSSGLTTSMEFSNFLSGFEKKSGIFKSTLQALYLISFVEAPSNGGTPQHNS